MHAAVTPMALDPLAAALGRTLHLAHGTHVTLRRLTPDDSVAELTAMLHASFSRLQRLGLNCSCADQTEAVTRSRLAAGDAFVAVCGRRLVGTVTLCHADGASPIHAYRCADTASLHQLGVAPDLQSRGLGAALLHLGECWAAGLGYRELALDTPKPASHLLSYYAHHGFHAVGVQRVAERNYVSAVLSKSVCRSEMHLGPSTASPAVRREAQPAAGSIALNRLMFVGRKPSLA